MLKFCPGWNDPRHPEKFLGEVAPFHDKSATHGLCDECREVMDRKIDSMLHHPLCPMVGYSRSLCMCAELKKADQEAA